MYVCVQEYMNVYMNARICKNMNAGQCRCSLHTYIHTYIHTYLHTYSDDQW
jgi:hypothetical protein